jgi:hypothetical protein
LRQYIPLHETHTETQTVTVTVTVTENAILMPPRYAWEPAFMEELWLLNLREEVLGKEKERNMRVKMVRPNAFYPVAAKGRQRLSD